MRDDHKVAFLDAAHQFTCWIGLREPNPLADKWIGRSGFIPKSATCKAKTADNARHKFGGLVTDPNVCPDAFKRDTLKEAKETWEKFQVAGRLPIGFTCFADGPQAGLVKYNGAAIHADYDLMAINRSDERGAFLPTSLQEQKQLYALVEAVLNRKFGAPMIQHGAEFMWDQGVGARASEYVLWFGPGRRFNRWPSSMPKGGH